MKKLLLILLCLPMIGFGQRTLDFSSYSELRNIDLQLVIPSGWKLMNIPNSIYLSSRDENALMYVIDVWDHEPLLSTSEKLQIKKSFLDTDAREMWVQNLSATYYPNNTTIKDQRFNLIDNTIHSLRVLIETDINGSPTEVVYWFFMHNNRSVLIGGSSSKESILSDEKIRYLDNITNSIKIK